VNFNDKYLGSRGRATLFIADSFVSYKNALNEPNFIDFGGGDPQLKNYPYFEFLYFIFI